MHMFYRRNSDAELRKLEREVATGQEDKIEQLKLVRKRMGLCPECGGELPQYYDVCWKCRPLQLSWDTCDIAESYVDSFIEQSEEEVEAGTRDEPLTRDEALHHIYQIEWEQIEENLTEWIKQMNPDFYDWCVTGRNMGWMRRTGFKQIPYNDGDTGSKLLRQILPDTDCTFTIYFNGSEMWISNAHHDGSESYDINLAKKCPYCEEEHCDEEELAECCKYVCEHCGDRYNHPEGAKNCCPYECAECGEKHSSLYRAQICCED